MSFDDVHQTVCHSTELSRASHDHGSCVGKWRSRAGHGETSPKGGTENQTRSRYKTWFLEVVFLVILARMIIDRGSKYQTKNSKLIGDPGLSLPKSAEKECLFGVYSHIYAAHRDLVHASESL